MDIVFAGMLISCLNSKKENSPVVFADVFLTVNAISTFESCRLELPSEKLIRFFEFMSRWHNCL